MTRPLLIALAALGLIAVPARAAAAGWLPATTIAGATSSATVAVDAAGDTFIAYVNTETHQVELIERPAGGSVGAPQTLSSGELLATAPSIAVDAAGDVVVAWEQLPLSGEYQAAAATRSAAGVLTKLGVLAGSGSGTPFPTTPSAAEDAAGAAIIAWVMPATANIEAVTRGAAAQAFGSQATGLGKGAGSINVMADAVDSAGDDVLAFDGGGQAWVLSGKNGSWATSSEQISNGGASLDGRLRLAVAGTQVVVVWSQGASPEEVFASRGTIGGGLTVSIDLSDATQNSESPSVATDPAGDSVVTWFVPPTSGVISDIRASTSSADGPFPLPTQTADLAEVASLTALGTATAMGPAGQAIVTWSHSAGGGHQSAVGTSWTPTAGFTPVQTISASGEHVGIGTQDAADPLGDDVASWNDETGAIAIAPFDAAPPELGAPAIPASASVGSAASFSVASPLDIWSPAVAVTWSFGDGTSASGDAVSHAYTRPGSFPVTVTAADLLGNTSEQSGSIAITAAPAPAAPAGSQPLQVSLTLGAFELTPARIHSGRRVATLATAKAKAKPSAAATISFVLSEAATVKLSFEAAHAGVLVGHRCGAPSKAHRKGRRCTRYLAVAHAITRAAHAGHDQIGFDGVLDGSAHLASGSYRLTLAASAGAAKAKAAQHPTLTLLR
jgi:hypothetical protein